MTIRFVRGKFTLLLPRPLLISNDTIKIYHSLFVLVGHNQPDQFWLLKVVRTTSGCGWMVCDDNSDCTIKDECQGMSFFWKSSTSCWGSAFMVLHDANLAMIKQSIHCDKTYNTTKQRFRARVAAPSSRLLLSGRVDEANTLGCATIPCGR